MSSDDEPRFRRSKDRTFAHKTLEAVALVRVSGMSIDAAAELVHLPRSVVVENLNTERILPHTPTPDDIERMCKPMRAAKIKQGEMVEPWRSERRSLAVSDLANS